MEAEDSFHGSPWKLLTLPWKSDVLPWKSSDFHGSVMEAVCRIPAPASMRLPWKYIRLPWKLTDFHGSRGGCFHGSSIFHFHESPRASMEVVTSMEVGAHKTTPTLRDTSMEARQLPNQLPWKLVDFHRLPSTLKLPWKWLGNPRYVDFHKLPWKSLSERPWK